MLQRSGDLNLAGTSLRTWGLADLGQEDFSRHAPAMPEIVRQEHDGHAATSKLAQEPVAARQGDLQSLLDVHTVRRWALSGRQGRGSASAAGGPSPLLREPPWAV